MSRSFISLLKDAALEKAALRYLQPKVERYGEITHLAINTTKRQLSAEVLLRGDPVPVKISQANYRLEGDGTDTKLVLFNIKVSREWVQNVLDDHQPEIELRIPAALRVVLGSGC